MLGRVYIVEMSLLVPLGAAFATASQTISRRILGMSMAFCGECGVVAGIMSRRQH